MRLMTQVTAASQYRHTGISPDADDKRRALAGMLN
jgi:hypothetical protein